MIRASSARWPRTLSCREFIELFRCEDEGASGHITAFAASTSIPISTNSYFATTADITDMFHSKRCWSSPPTKSPQAIGTSSSETIHEKGGPGRDRRPYYI